MDSPARSQREKARSSSADRAPEIEINPLRAICNLPREDDDYDEESAVGAVDGVEGARRLDEKDEGSENGKEKTRVSKL